MQHIYVSFRKDTYLQAMAKIDQLIAAHPLQEMPYSSIRFCRTDGQRTPLYEVTGLQNATGAKEALSRAFEKLGGRCFHCEKPLPAQKISQRVNRDHIRPISKGGSDFLHNLVISCGSCNRQKADKDIVTFKVERGDKYLKALDEHIVRCLKNLDSK